LLIRRPPTLLVDKDGEDKHHLASADLHTKGEERMSAFICNNEHINAMLQAASLGDHTRSQYPPSYYWEEDGKAESRDIRPSDEAIGQKLVDENFRSVNYRYQESEEPYRFQPLPFQKRYSLAQILKACNCYIYQACEHAEWKGSEAHAIVKALKERAIVLLPSYDDAMWEVLEA